MPLLFFVNTCLVENLWITCGKVEQKLWITCGKVEFDATNHKNASYLLGFTICNFYKPITNNIVVVGSTKKLL